jgi:hypothetical protein
VLGLALLVKEILVAPALFQPVTAHQVAVAALAQLD